MKNLSPTTIAIKLTILNFIKGNLMKQFKFLSQTAQMLRLAKLLLANQNL